MSELTQMVEDFGQRMVEVKTALEGKADAEVIQEQMEGIQEELKALAEGRKFKHLGNIPRDQRLVGTKWDRIADPMTGRKYDANDVELVHDLLVEAARYGISKDGPSEKLQNLHEEITTRTPDGDTETERAMDTAESGYGSQLVGVEYVSDLWRAAYQASVIFGLIPTREMQHPSQYLPVGAAFPEMMFVSENTASDSSDYSTTKTGSQRVNVAAKKFIIHQVYSGEMEEDSIIPWVPFLREQAQHSLGYYMDSAVLNGDTTNAGTGNINLDDADPADTKHYLAWDGIRHIGIVDNTNNQKDMAAAIDYDNLLKIRQKMLDTTYKMNWGYPANPSDLVYVCDLEGTLDAISLLDEVVTVDKFGPQATVATGQQARIGRNPLVATLAMGLTEADGKISDTGGNNTKGQVAVFNRQGFVIGWRRRVKFEMERLPGRDQTRIIWSLRAGFGRYSPTGAASGIETAALIFDITV